MKLGLSKGIIALLITSMLVVSAFANMNIPVVENVKAMVNKPHDDGSGNGDEDADDGIFATDGDWTINVGETFEYSPAGTASEPKPCIEIIVNGDLTIEEASSLKLSGVTF